jgi:hypothetical protein
MAGDPFTLVVALDEYGQASGDLYLDDGSSFAFAQGAYLHRRCVAAMLPTTLIAMMTMTPQGHHLITITCHNYSHLIHYVCIH